jgi:pantoate--beta-alanine ligase
MQLIDSPRAMQAQARSWRAAGWRIAFVPTMGNLHAGHLSLVRAAAQQADRVVVSIFVNPLQFNDVADFQHYPRTLEADLASLQPLQPAAVFVPDERQMYPAGRTSVTRVEVPQLGEMLEGAARPGHFSGMATVVSKLFNCVMPDVALFGEKDYQQLLIIRKLVADLDLPIRILSLPTVRESDGLAMSSRNSRLTTQQRRQALGLYQTLCWVNEQLRQAGVNLRELETRAEQRLRDQGLVPEYVSIRQAHDLQAAEPGMSGLIILAAAQLGEVRLIDNLRVD